MPELLGEVVGGFRRLGEVVRWSEPWDIEAGDDPLDDGGPVRTDERFDRWV